MVKFRFFLQRKRKIKQIFSNQILSNRFSNSFLIFEAFVFELKNGLFRCIDFELSVHFVSSLTVSSAFVFLYEKKLRNNPLKFPFPFSLRRKKPTKNKKIFHDQFRIHVKSDIRYRKTNTTNNILILICMVKQSKKNATHATYTNIERMILCT